MAYGYTRSTGLTPFVHYTTVAGTKVATAAGTGTKVALGYLGTAASGAVTMVGDIQPAGGAVPTGSRYSVLPSADVIKSAFLMKITTPAAPTDVTNKASITADNQVTLSGLSASASGCMLLVVFEQADKMGDKD